MQNSEQLLLTSATQLADDYWIYINNYKKNSNPDTIIKIAKIAELFYKMKTAFLLHAYSYDERTPGAVLFLLIITAV